MSRDLLPPPAAPIDRPTPTRRTGRRVALSLGSVAALVASFAVATALAQPAHASTTDAAFSSGTGALNVDYAGYLSKHDVVDNSPTTNPLYGLTVGNGHTGAMVWSQNGITAQVSGVDLSEQSTYAAGNVNLQTTPAIDSGYTTYQQRLSLYDGTLTTKYDSNRTVTVLGSPANASGSPEVLGLHVDDSRSGVSAITLDLSMWDPSTVTNSGDVPDLTTWKTISTFADANGAGFSRGQSDANGFGYTFAATVEGASSTASVVNGTRVRLTITPTSSYTIWLVAASRINAANRDSVTAARNQLASVKSTGYATTLANYKSWWHSFWSRSFVQYSTANGDADYIENVYYLATYMIAAGGYGNYPFHFINGVFRATQDTTKWSNAYWYWNQRDVYNSFLASNHVDLISTFNKLYSRNSSALKSYTQTRYGIDGLWVPETMGWDGNARGTVGSDYTKDILSTGTEAAYNMYLQYRYSNDTSYLQNTAYPFIRDVVKFYAAKLSKDSNGKYYMAVSNSHETYWDVKDAVTDLAAVRLLFPIAIQVSTQLGQDSGARASWQSIVDNLVPYPTQNGAYLPMDPPVAATHNGENVASELIWPYDRTGIGASDYQTALNTWNSRPFPYGNVWANDAVQAARLGLGDQALSGMKTMLQKYQNYPNGMTSNTNGVFEYLGVNLAALNESLLQSYTGKIRVFPAAPSDSSFVGKFTLLAEDGFQVSSEREGGDIKYVGIKSLYGKQATVINPWSGQSVQVRRASDNAILTTSSAAEISFATATNTVYVVERVAKPLSSYSSTTLTGSANQGQKSLSNTASTLGISAGATNGPTFYPDINYGGTGVKLGVGNYDLAQLQSTGIGNDAISSIRVPSGFTVTAYADSGFSGTSWTFTADNANLINSGNNDAISSLKITSSGSGTALRAHANSQYVTAGANPLIANSTTVGAAQLFDLVDQGNGNVALRAHANSQWVCAENAGAAALIANRASVGQWETFQLIQNSDGSVSFKSAANGMYVTADNGGAAALIANRTAIGPWEEFDRVTS
jgi:alpha-L-fucosidase 2